MDPDHSTLLLHAYLALTQLRRARLKSHNSNSNYYSESKRDLGTQSECSSTPFYSRRSVDEVLPIVLQLMRERERAETATRPACDAFEKGFEIDAVELIKKVNDSNTRAEAMRAQLAKIVNGACGFAPPMATLAAGVVAQQILIAVTKRYVPIHQFHVSFFDVLGDYLPSSAEPSPLESTHEYPLGQSMLFGAPLLRAISHLPILQVGCGATGCEAAKILGLMGTRELVLADHDYFDLSNQTRQFVARANRGGNQARAKCHALQSEMKRLYPAIAAKSLAYEVSDENANYFSDEFYRGLGLILATVDSNEARAYLSHVADFHNLQFVECGTNNLCGSSTMFLPGLTAHFPESPSERQLDDGLSCQVKEFPYRDTD